MLSQENGMVIILVFQKDYLVRNMESLDWSGSNWIQGNQSIGRCRNPDEK